jgi:hypothetical protein
MRNLVLLCEASPQHVLAHALAPKHRKPSRKGYDSVCPPQPILARACPCPSSLLPFLWS